MKKIISLVLSVLMIALLCSALVVSSAAATKSTEWICWVKNGNEITQGKVTESTEGIVASLSSNYSSRQQNSQSKITDTYWSPATIWTDDASKDLVVTWDINSNAFVEIGFLHCIGKTGSGVSDVCVPDGSDLGSKLKFEWSTDGSKWNEIDYDIYEGDHVLVSGMTGYEATDIKPYNGNVSAGADANEYSEVYYIISGNTGDNAKYVRLTYLANSRLNYWDPCIRDALFTYKVEDEVDSSNVVDLSSAAPSEETSKETVVTEVNVLEGIHYTADGGNRTGGYGDFEDDGVTCKYLLSDGIWSASGDANVAGYDSGLVNFVFDLGEKKDNLFKFVSDGFDNSSWGIGSPVSVEFSISDDGENYTSLGIINAADLTPTALSGWNQYMFELKLDTAVSAQFVKVTYTGTGFTWPSEMQVLQTVASEKPTDPTSDNGIVALAIIAAIAVAGAVVIKKTR